MSYLISSEKIPFAEFGKMLADMLPNEETTTGDDWYLDNSMIEVNKDILYDSLHGETVIGGGEKFFIIEGPYDNDGQSQAELFVKSISEKIGDKIVLHNLDDAGVFGHGKNGEPLQKCWKENSYKTVEDMIKNLDSIPKANLEQTTAKLSVREIFTLNEADIREDKNIGELMNILSDYKKNQESEQITLLLDQINQIGENFNAVVKELNTVKEELNLLQNAPQSMKKQSVIVDSLAEFENKVQDQYQQLQSMKNGLSNKAKILVQKFKETGIKALNNVCGFLGIKESLVNLRDMAQSNAADMQNSIDKIDKIGFEVKSAVTHAKNAGRAIAGKEMIDLSTVEQFKIFEKLKVPYQQKKEKFTNQVEKLSKTIEKFESLEKAADKVSVREKLRNNQAKIAAEEASELKPEKEKPHQQDLAL